jgi:hypothetical protein
MSNATSEVDLAGIGQDGRRFHVPCKTSTTIYAGTMVAQQVSDGLLVAATSAGAGPVIGVATHTITSATAGQRCVVETDRIYLFTNGLTTDAFSDASLIGSPVYALDDNSVADNDNSGTLQQCGTFQGMEAGTTPKVRVLISPAAVRGALSVQAGTSTFVAGVKAISAGITVTATSRVFASRVTEGGTDGDEIRVPSADRTVGGPGTGSLTFRSFLSGVAATSDTSTFDYLIVG